MAPLNQVNPDVKLNTIFATLSLNSEQSNKIIQRCKLTYKHLIK